MKKLAIFDLDGTLIDSVEDLADAMNKVLVNNDYRIHDLEDYRQFVGNGVKKLITRSLDEKYRTDEIIDRLLVEFVKNYAQNVCEKTKPYNGIIDVITALKEKGFYLAVCSNKPHENTEFIVKKLFGENTFDMIVGNKEGIAHKPDPAVINMIINHFNVSKDQAVLIGDSDVDITTGVNASIDTIGCTWGYRTKDVLIEAGAKHIVYDPYEILNTLLK